MRGGNIFSGENCNGVVDQRRADIGVRVQNVDLIKAHCVDKFRKPFERENLVTVLHTIHSGVRQIGNIQNLPSLREAIPQMLRKIPQADAFLFARIEPSDHDALAILKVKPRTAER